MALRLHSLLLLLHILGTARAFIPRNEAQSRIIPTILHDQSERYHTKLVPTDFQPTLGVPVEQQHGLFGKAYTPVKLQVPPLAEGHRRLYLVRHGETDWNTIKKLQGSTDIALNANGRAQAALLGSFLRDVPIDLIVSSSLSRARDTALALAHSHPEAITLPNNDLFTEMNFGSLEGVIEPNRAPIFKMWEAGNTEARWPGQGGESLHDVAIRGLEGLRQLGFGEHSEASEEYESARYVAVVSHGRFAKILMATLQGDQTNFAQVKQGNTCVNVLDFDSEGKLFEIQAQNVMDHVKALEQYNLWQQQSHSLLSNYGSLLDMDLRLPSKPAASASHLRKNEKNG